MEFLETFETHHNMKTQGQNDSRVTMEEFVEYYNNISASIDNDEYFALMMNNSWNIKGDAQTYQKYDKSWANEDAQAKPVYRQPPAPVQRSGKMSNDNPLVTTNHFYSEITTASRSNASKYMYGAPPMKKEEEEKQKAEMTR
jgi:hypothetical protein